MDKYLTTSDVNNIMSNIGQIEAHKCLGRMSDYVETLEYQQILRNRWRGNI